MLVKSFKISLPNLRTVAGIAGVSVATVSRVLNADPAVKGKPRPTVQNADLSALPAALFTSNNPLTFGALKTILKQALKIPEEIAIVGPDDVYGSTSLNPPLTAVQQHGFEIGQRAFELFYRCIANPDRIPAGFIIKTDLMIANPVAPKPRLNFEQNINVYKGLPTRPDKEGKITQQTNFEKGRAVNSLLKPTAAG